MNNVEFKANNNQVELIKYSLKVLNNPVRKKKLEQVASMMEDAGIDYPEFKYAYNRLYYAIHILKVKGSKNLFIKSLNEVINILNNFLRSFKENAITVA